MKKYFVILILIAIAAAAVFAYLRTDEPVVLDNSPQEETESETLPKTISIDVYVQDKEIAYASDCGVTQKVKYEIPHTYAVIDESLKILFADELKQYGEYDSVNVKYGIAQIALKNERTASGSTIGALSSCEGAHLMSVLTDTVTQYPNINSIEIYTPSGKVEF